jgi:hypothetical protein
MKILDAIKLYTNYLNFPVSNLIHPSERMMAKSIDIYQSVGRDAIRSVMAGLCLSLKTSSITKVLDYGCGHGRVARHLRAFFPESEMWFADIRPDGVNFCANEFIGKEVILPSDFSKQILPSGIDLIWVGSVFTHIDFERAKILFTLLFDKLACGGLLIMTTHGRSKLSTSGRASLGPGWVEKIENQYFSTGYGYTTYGREDLGDWGISIMDMKLCGEFLCLRKGAELVSYGECGWAGQDVMIISKNIH